MGETLKRAKALLVLQEILRACGEKIGMTSISLENPLSDCSIRIFYPPEIGAEIHIDNIACKHGLVVEKSKDSIFIRS